MSGRRLAAFVVLITLAEHAASIAAERVAPRDLNAAWASLPRHVEAIRGGTLLELWEPGAWLQALAAAAIVLFGRSAEVFQGVTLLWVALALVAVAGLTRSARAVALAAQVPALVVLPRGGWIHSPEAALALALGWLIVGYPPEGARTSRWLGGVASHAGRDRMATILGALRVVGLATTGAAIVLLRSSGVLWVGVAAVALLVRRGSSFRANVAVLAVWALAALPAASGMFGYARGKVALAERYAVTVPDLLPQIVEHLGGAGMMLVGGCVVWRMYTSWKGGEVGSVGAAAGAVGAALRAHPDRAVLIGGWLVLPLLAVAVTHAGLDNFPLFFAAIVLVAVGPATVRGEGVLTTLVLAGWVVSVVGRLSMPEAEGPSPRARVAALLDATCPARGGEGDSALADDAPRAPGGGTQTCTVVVDQGLYHPFAEDDTLELYLAEEDHVRLVGLHRLARSNVPMPAPDALITWDCGERNAMWRQRYPTNDQDRLRFVRRFGLEARTRVRAEGCELIWMTP